MAPTQWLYILIICYPIACSVTQLLDMFRSLWWWQRDDLYLSHSVSVYKSLLCKVHSILFCLSGILCDLIIIFTVTRIEDLTDNIRVGFGSFNDKLTCPYAYIPVPPSGGGACPVCDFQPSLYTFRHQITLTDNITFYNVGKHVHVHTRPWKVCRFVFYILYYQSHT